MKVKIIKGDYWYIREEGVVFEVYPELDRDNDYRCKEPAGHYISAGDCEVLQTLQEQLQAAKDNVAELEKLSAKEAEREDNRPFTREEYERVVAQYRACKGRKVFEFKADCNYCVEMFQNRVTVDNYPQAGTSAMFNVWFSEEDFAWDAIKEVGEENLHKAWQFEMSIGL